MGNGGMIIGWGWGMRRKEVINVFIVYVRFRSGIRGIVQRLGSSCRGERLNAQRGQHWIKT